MTEVENFGRNVRFTPKNYLQPDDEAAVLAILEKYRGQAVRVVGSRHSWSQLLHSESVILDLRRLKEIRVQQDGDQYLAFVGAGCRIRELLRELKRIGDVTLPSIGLIDQQTIAGAISTGTHGSGKHSLSHYVAEVRVATYAEDGTVTIRSIDAQDAFALRAARCSLGAMGVILSVVVRCRKSYRVEEHMRHHATLADVLSQESAYPLQQFYFVPWLWEFYVQHRLEVDEPPSRHAWLFHFYWFWLIDFGMHIGICLLARWMRSPSLTKFYFRSLAPNMTVTNWRVVDDASKMLLMKHELFRHIEIEIFVRDRDLADALAFIESLLKVCGGDEISDSLAETLSRKKLTDKGALERLTLLRGKYTHCYPMCVRRILADETLVSMASGTETVYSISFISYQRRDDRDEFLRFAELLAESTAELFEARPHWGKINPLSAEELRKLYPDWDAFRESCDRYDPQGVFRNARLQELLSQS